MTHPYSLYIWQLPLSPTGEGSWIEPLQAYTQGYAFYVATLIHQDTRSVIKVVRYGLIIQCYPDAHAVDLVRDDAIPSARREPASGKRDGRLKGEAPRERANVRLDPEVLAFLRSIKASKQQAAKEPGYSGFLEDLVRATPQFAAWRATRR